MNETELGVNRQAPAYASAEAVIEVPAERVWHVLADLRQWPSWNRSVSGVSMYGELEVGTEFRWKADGVTIVSELLQVETQRHLLWKGRSPGVRATHLWIVEAQGDKTRVYTEECLEGLMARLLSRPMTRMLSNTLSQTLNYLKEEIEQQR